MTTHHVLFRLPGVCLIALALGCAVACSSDTTSPSNPNDPTLVTVFISNGVYSPNPAVVNLGQSVNWKNNDSVTHTATSVSGPVTFNSNDISPNSAHGAPVVMNAKGTISYKCTIHGETASIIVQ